jgi:hypothetical protein
MEHVLFKSSLKYQSRWRRQFIRFSPGTSVSPANHHSTNFSVIIITRGWHSRPLGGRSVEWTKLAPTPPQYHFKKLSGTQPKLR